MKKPLLTLCLVSVAVACAWTQIRPDSSAKAPGTSQKATSAASTAKTLNTAAKAGAITQHQADTIAKIQDIANDRSKMADQVMNDGNVNAKPAQAVAGQADPKLGQLDPTAPAAAKAAAAPAPMIHWRFEGTVTGGKKPARAVFEIGNAPLILKAGDRLDAYTKVVGVTKTSVQIQNKKGEISEIAPW